MNVSPACQHVAAVLRLEKFEARSIGNSQQHLAHIKGLSDIRVTKAQELFGRVQRRRIVAGREEWSRVSEGSYPLTSLLNRIKPGRRTVSMLSDSNTEKRFTYSSMASWSASPVLVPCTWAPPNSSAPIVSPVAILTNDGPPRKTCA